MPFSEGGVSVFLQILDIRDSLKSKNKNKKTHPLQVRIPPDLPSVFRSSDFGKKAFQAVPGSMTLEASLALTLFLFACVCLILPMKVMNTERKVQAAMESVAEDFSRYAYLKDAMDHSKAFAVVGAGDFARGFCRYLADGIGKGYAQARILEYVDTPAFERFSVQNSEIFTDGEYIDLIVDYEIRFPFPMLGLSGLERRCRCRRRAWVGKAGKDYGEETDAGENPDRIVYVGKGSARYHLSRSCHYLSNDLKSISAAALENERNKNGGRYRPCAVCGNRAAETVYILPSGSSYHTDPDCTAIIAYVRAVRLSEVEHLGACSYCGGG